MLRDYQRETLEAIRDEFAAGVTRQLVVKPTGTGKAVDFAHLPNYMAMRPGEQMLLLVHRDELVYQGAEKCRKYNPRLVVDIEKAEYRARPTSDIIVASVQTLRTRQDKNTGEVIYSDRLSRFDPERFRIIVVDEAHHAVADSYKNILRYFRVLKEAPGDPTKLLVGFTATPKRGDSIGLEEIFDKIVFQRNIRDMVEQKWLCEIHAYRISTTCDISQVKTRAGDFAEGQLSDTVDIFERNRLIVQEYQKLGEGLTAIAFTVSIQHSEDLAEVFRDRGISAAALSGKTPHEERRELIAQHKAGDLKVLCSCGILNEGADIPRASVGLMTRPTKSSLLFIQQIGRLLRPYPAPEDLAAMQARGEQPDWIKEKAIILDFVDQTGRHEIITTPTLFGLRADFNTEGKSVTKTKKAIEDLLRLNPGLDIGDGRTLEEIKAIVERVDLLRAPRVPPEVVRSSKFAWLKDGDGYRLSLPDYTTTLLVRENSLGQFEVFQAVSGVRQLTGTARDLSSAFVFADQMVPTTSIGALLTKAKWRQDPPSEKQAFWVWKKDRQVHQQFRTPAEYYEFAMGRWKTGNMEFSKGAFSIKLDSLQTARPAAVRG